MDININRNNCGYTNVGGVMETIAAGEANEASGKSQTARVSPSLTITEDAATLGEASIPVNLANVELVRDDPIGKLVNSAFNLPPPPMPEFA